MSEENKSIDILRGGDDTAIRLAEVMGPWERFRPAKIFYSMTIDQFKAEVKPYTDALKKIAALKDDLQNVNAELEAAEPHVRKLINGVVAAVKADREDGGEDGPLYTAMGYTPISKRASGMVRRRKNPPATDGSASS